MKEKRKKKIRVMNKNKVILRVKSLKVEMDIIRIIVVN
jgi:hypothetical protein